MATVTVNTPEPVVPPSTITVKMTVEEAAYVTKLALRAIRAFRSRQGADFIIVEPA